MDAVTKLQISRRVCGVMFLFFFGSSGLASSYRNGLVRYLGADVTVAQGEDADKVQRTPCKCHRVLAVDGRVQRAVI